MIVDTVLRNGSVWTPGWSVSRRGSVAVADGRVVAVGPDDAVAPLAGARTRVVDVAGGLVLPGFQDAHVHPVWAGVQMLRCDLHGATSAQECLDLVAAYALTHPGEEWIVGGGWSMEFFPGGTPTREQLDAVVPDRPVSLLNRDGHGSWVNSAALRRAGIDAATPDPPDGRIERDDADRPTGTLHEGAVDIVDRLIPSVTPEQELTGLLEAQRVLLAAGVTSWQDAAVGEMFGLHDVQDVYRRAAATGRLRARVVGALWWDRERGVEQVRDLIDRREDGAAPGFRPTTVKVMQDGVVENFTAAMTEPYLDGCGGATSNSGLSFVDPIELRECVTRLDGAGFQVHLHTLGDRAVREALDAVAAAIDVNGRRQNRHQLAHLQVVHPDDVPRFAALDVTANIQPLWAAHEPQMDELTIPFLGEERSSWQYPFAALLASGADVAAGSDWPVTRPDPMWGAHVAVNRVSPGGRARPFYPHNAITLAQVLTAYTAGSARANHQEESTGELREGMLADLVVLDRDPFAAPPERIAEAVVTHTFVGGDCVYTAD